MFGFLFPKSGFSRLEFDIFPKLDFFSKEFHMVFVLYIRSPSLFERVQVHYSHVLLLFSSLSLSLYLRISFNSEMLRWAHLTAGILSVAVLSSLLLVFLRRWCCLRGPESSTALNAASPVRSNSFQARISKLHQTSLIHQLDTSDIKRRGNINNYSVSRGTATGGFPSKPGLFVWTDHPALVTEAVENGWTRFGFAVHASAPLMVGAASPRSALLGLCATNGSEDPCVVITWEVSNGSVDFTQTIKFNQVVNGKNPLMVLRAALPLPGPQLISSPFPQEAYFEITLLHVLLRGGGVSDVGNDLASVEGEKTKLFKIAGELQREWEGENQEAVLSIGLAIGRSVGVGEARLPGKFPASIGFQSDGAVYLDGMYLFNLFYLHHFMFKHFYFHDIQNVTNLPRWKSNKNSSRKVNSA